MIGVSWSHRTGGGRRWLPPWLWTVAVVIAALAAPPSHAHNIGQSYLYLQIYDGSVTDRFVTGRFEVALSDLNAARIFASTKEEITADDVDFEIDLSKLDPGVGFTTVEDEITAENLDQRVGFLEDYYRDHVTISHQGKPLGIRFREHGFLEAKGGYVLLPFDLEGLEGVPESLTFDYSVLFDETPDHRGFLLVEHHWGTGTFANENGISLTFSPDARHQNFDLPTASPMNGFLAVAWLGIEHIWESLDHLFFLVTLLFAAVLRRKDGRWVPVEHFLPALIQGLKIVATFTIAHSVTLWLAGLGVLDLPGRPVEAIVAASIFLAAANLLIPIFNRKEWLVALGFGLVHGFSFARTLWKMGALEDHVGLSLLAFNLGIEIGQAVVVLALVPVLLVVRRWAIYRKWFLPAAAVFMLLISTLWFVERAFGVDIPITESAKAIIEMVLP
jgi:hypothetical protein